jgi:polysaccharide export outer membrane protein
MDGLMAGTRFLPGGARRGKRAFLAVAALAFLASCSGQMRFPVTVADQQDLAAQNIEVVRITPENIEQYRRPTFRVDQSRRLNPPPGVHTYTYRVGAGDQLRVTVYVDPEGTQTATESPRDGSTGIVINESGEFFYPFVGAVRASGRTVAEIRQDLAQRLRTYIADPQVDVSVLNFNAHRATITGAVTNPGATVLTNVPRTLLDLVNAAEATEFADLRRVSIRRRGTNYIVDLKAFIDRGEPRNNPIILPGDLINIPVNETNKVFTFGEIDTQEVLLGESMTLTEVLAQVGGIDRVRADARGIFVFRRTPDTPDGFIVFQFDLRSAAALVLATDFQMAPLDVVFVTNDPVTRWNDTIGVVLTPVAGLAQLRVALR